MLRFKLKLRFKGAAASKANTQIGTEGFNPKVPSELTEGLCDKNRVISGEGRNGKDLAHKSEHNIFSFHTQESYK